MRAINVQKWDESQTGELSEEAIRGLFQPPGAYRISRRKYPAGARFGGTQRAGQLFVLAGKCMLLLPEEITVSRGEMVEFPAGDFEQIALGQDDLETIQVWLLPKEFHVQS